VPDLAGFAAANDLVGKSDVEVREAVGDKFHLSLDRLHWYLGCASGKTRDDMRHISRLARPD
jgi:hypothetical protein